MYDDDHRRLACGRSLFGGPPPRFMDVTDQMLFAGLLAAHSTPPGPRAMPMFNDQRSRPTVTKLAI